MNHRYAPPPPETLAPLTERVNALRRKQWSDTAIARYLDVPVDEVRRILGIGRSLVAGGSRLLVAGDSRLLVAGDSPAGEPAASDAKPKNTKKVDVETAVRLRREGLRQADIARRFGVSRAAVSQALKREAQR